MFIYLAAFLFWSVLGAVVGWLADGQSAAGLGAWLGSVLWALLQLWRAHRLDSHFTADSMSAMAVWRTSAPLTT